MDSPGAGARGPLLQGDVEDGFPAEGRRWGIRRCVTRKTYCYEKMDSGGSPAAPGPRFRRHGVGAGTHLSVEHAHARYLARSAGSGCPRNARGLRRMARGSRSPSGAPTATAALPTCCPSAGSPTTGSTGFRFETAPYFEALGERSIYPWVEVVFRIEGSGHYHIPITMSANGYATYRGN